METTYYVLLGSNTYFGLNRTMQYGNSEEKKENERRWKVFKSYYVVWKLFKPKWKPHVTPSLNRTMQYGNCDEKRVEV